MDVIVKLKGVPVGGGGGGGGGGQGGCEPRILKLL